MISESRKKLLGYQATGNYVFHGSGSLSDFLIPKQAYQRRKGEPPVKDGEPAIWASTEIEIPIFMSIFNKQNAPKGFRSGFGINNNVIELSASQKGIDQVKDNSTGYVYVLDKNNFRESNEGSNQYISNKEEKPIDVVKVSFKDIKTNIKIIED